MKKTLRYAMVLSVLMNWLIPAKAQTDYSGTYYIASVGYNAANTTTNYYLCPTEGWCYYKHVDDFWPHTTAEENKTMPFLTTYRCRDGNYDARKAVWTIEKAPAPNDDYYYIIQALTGRYLTSNGTIRTTNNADRLRVHLEAVAPENLDDKELFTITTYSTYLTISPKGVTGGAADRNWLVVNGGNKNALTGQSGKQNGPTGYTNTAGIIGVYTQDDTNAPFYLEPALGITPTPTITNNFDGTITITGTGTIYYTTDGTEPTVSSPTYSTPITLTDGITVIKAMAKDGANYESLVAAYELQECEAPVISFDNITSLVTLTSATAGSAIHYTTDGSAPTAASPGYSSPFTVSSATTVKAIAITLGYVSSTVTELAIPQVATPTIQNNGNNAISITTTTSEATIYYTTDGSTPTTSSTEYTDPLTENISNVTIKAIAVKEGMITSAVGSGTVKLQCATPVITRDHLTFTLSCGFPTDANLYYMLDGGSEVAYTGTPVSFTPDQLPMTVTAVARHSDYTESGIASLTLFNGTGTPSDPYLIYGVTDFSNFVTNVNNGSTASACYKLEADITVSGVAAITTAFTGTFDGAMHTLNYLGHALFDSVNGGTVKNVILDNVTISGSTTVNVGGEDKEATGAIANVATGASRIYNCGILATNSTVEKDDDGYDIITSCSSTISGSGYVGGIVGLLDGSSRVINCFSYADVSGGTHVGGIVGYNNVAVTSGNLQTMVMNCMFYGEVVGSSIAPIYNGEIITNDGDANGVNNFNYFRLESSYIQNTGITKVYNCALGAETRFLQRFEFFRHLLNSNRELAAWWATGNATNKDEMMKWVMEPSQRGTATPYPILKTPGKYASVVNYTPNETPYDEEHRCQGRKLTNEGDGGVLHVTIQMGSGGAQYDAPSGAGLKDGETGIFDLTITDKDFEHFNFNYAKVQLPYYNDYCVGNYTGNRVVTGWKIVSITGGTPGSYSTGADVTYTNGELTATPYNFADRKCTNKDLYSQSGRVFNQGAYWDVPEGVTAITIQPYWGKAVYLADAYWDVVYKDGNDAMVTAANVLAVGGGQHYGNGETFNGQTVHTAIGNAISSSNANGLFYKAGQTTSHTVYDYAVVLVGNYHGNYNDGSPEATEGKPYTVTSVDLDGDNEPDYSFLLRFNGRKAFHPVRYDFLNLIGLGMAQKTTGGNGSYNLGIMQPKFWFEVTNTGLFRVTQFEYSRADRVKKPIILQGGVIEQWVTQQDNAGDRVEYFHIGGNVWFKEFHRGSHQDNTNKSTPHPPLSVTGGDFAKFYLTGYYQSQAAIYDDNAECYINGGRFGEVAGAGMEGIGVNDGKGNITWVIDNADIKEFYGGGINAAKPVHGNIHTIISNSHVDVFCGGPKFGNMVSGRTVKTTATNCTFGTYFGAGYGGNSYNRIAPRNHNAIVNFPHNDNQAGNHASWNAWLAAYYKQDYNATYGGVSTQFDYQFLPMSSNTSNVARIFVEYVGFSLATTNNVTSDLTGCTVTGNFYGGGSLGKVEGNVTSTLENCTVNGNVFGAGYSASLPTVEVMNIGFETEPYYYEDLGTYRKGVFPPTTTYHWEYKETVNSTADAIDKDNHILYTTADLTVLGTVSGDVTLNITGNTLVEGKIFDVDGNVIGQTGGVYGGGDESRVIKEGTDNKTVTVNINTTGSSTRYLNNVFGGGNKGDVASNVEVTIGGASGVAPYVLHDVYGGGALALVNATISPTDTTYTDGTSTNVTMVNGTVAGNVYGGGLGQKNGENGATNDVEAMVYGPVTVNVNGGTVLGSVFGCNNLNGAPQSTVEVNMTGGTVTNVYGGGNHADYDGTPDVNIISGTVTTNVYGGGNDIFAVGKGVLASDVVMTGGIVNGGVYGGCNLNGTVETVSSVTISGGTVGTSGNEYGAVYGGGLGAATKVKGDVAVTIGGGTINNDVYGGSAKGLVNCNDAGDANNADSHTEVTLNSGTINGSLYGGGHGLDNASANVWGPVTVTVNGGSVTNVYGCNNLNGSPQDSVKVFVENGTVNHDVFGGGNRAAYGGTVSATLGGCPVVYMHGGNARNLFGGGNEATVDSTAVIMTGGTVDTIFGGGNKAGIIGAAAVTLISGTVNGGLYGGCNSSGEVTGKITVNVNGGIVGSADNLNASVPVLANVFGGGYGVNTSTASDVEVNIGVNPTTHSDFPKIYGDVYGGSAFGNVNADKKNSTVVNVLNGTLYTNPKEEHTAGGHAYYIYRGGNVYGGGLGRKDDDSTPGVNEAIEAKVYGKVTVNIGASGNAKTIVPETNLGEAIIKGNVYGCNNTNGSPQDSVTVNIYKTYRIATDEVNYEGTEPATFALNNVFGGGNEADYNPPVDGKKSLVLVHGCYNSVRRLFGGSNAAASGTAAGSDPSASPEIPVDVVTTIDGGRFAEVFGGGNGEVKAANVFGNVRLEIHGGVIGEFYIGSNQQGAITGSSDINIDQSSGCDEILISEFYCGGKYATVVGNIEATITCSQGMHVTNLYGGCKEADVVAGNGGTGSVHLIVMGGIFENIYGGSRGTETKGADIEGNVLLEVFGGTVTNAIFGGSNVKGDIGGSIVVNIEDKYPNDDCPLIISTADVYGGGNKADYNPSNAGTGDYPEVNIKNAIVNNVFGGGLEAEVTGNPQIHIKKWTKILGNVYGGGNMGKVTGNPRVIVNSQLQ